MPKAGDFIIIHMVDEVGLGLTFKRKRLDWPLHITVVPWFQLSKPELLDDVITSAVSGVRSFDARIGEDTAFGPSRDIPVNLVSDPESFRALQTKLITALKNINAALENEQWVGGAYRPHVTHHGEHRLYSGNIEQINDIHLVQVDAQNICKVVNRFPLSSRQDSK